MATGRGVGATLHLRQIGFASGEVGWGVDADRLPWLSLDGRRTGGVALSWEQVAEIGFSDARHGFVLVAGSEPNDLPPYVTRDGGRAWRFSFQGAQAAGLAAPRTAGCWRGRSSTAPQRAAGPGVRS